MRESTGKMAAILKAAYRHVQPYLDSDIDVEVNKANLGFSVCFRHDMDRMNEQDLETFLKEEEDLDVPSTLFFLESQYSRFPEAIRAVNRQKYECALHSEAKPSPFCWSLFQLSRLLEQSYSSRLNRQARKFERSVGPTLGHAAHAVNNYLPFQGWINWNIIENASLRSGFDYISDWRLPSRVAEGEDFMPPWPAYIRRRGHREILVLPTSWDDKYFLYSYEDIRIRQLVSSDVAYRDRDAASAVASALAQAETCRSLDTPFILNIHPWHSIANGQSQFLELKRALIEWSNSNGIRMLRCKDYGARASLKRTIVNGT